VRVDEGTVILGVETSCDETAAAVVMGGTDVLSSVVSSQIDIHAKFGGVVPEVASRAHLELIQPVITEAIDGAGIAPERIDAIAVTVGPGLMGALLVGVSAAKALAYGLNKPLVGVNHLEAHLYAGLLDDPHLQFPAVVLLVSGGNTLLLHMPAPSEYSLLGATIDDAAGEAFDKIARFLDIGYPGGPAIDAAAARGNPTSIDFPRAMMHDGLDFSFSGLKTAVINHVRKNPDVSSDNVAASFQAAVVDVLVAKTMKAARQVQARSIVLGGGVAANSQLRTDMTAGGEAEGFAVALPSRAMCTDNAAMIAAAGWYRLRDHGPSSLDIGAVPNLALVANTVRTNRAAHK
jgi:N6-L-threonylcarbamoyladenine synthase